MLSSPITQNRSFPSSLGTPSHQPLHDDFLFYYASSLSTSLIRLYYTSRQSRPRVFRVSTSLTSSGPFLLGHLHQEQSHLLESCNYEWDTSRSCVLTRRRRRRRYDIPPHGFGTLLPRYLHTESTSFENDVTVALVAGTSLPLVGRLPSRPQYSIRRVLLSRYYDDDHFVGHSAHLPSRRKKLLNRHTLRNNTTSHNQLEVQQYTIDTTPID